MLPAWRWYDRVMQRVPDSVTVLHTRVRDLARAHPDHTEEEIASSLIDEVSGSARRDLTIVAMQDWCWRVRREDQLAIERAAQHEREQAAAHRRADQVDRNVVSTEPNARFLAILDDPSVLYGGRTDSTDTRRCDYLDCHARKRFRRWCGAERFGDWHRRARQVVNALNDDDRTEMFLEDWHPDGVSGRRYEVMAEKTAVLIDEYSARIRVEFTAELLASEFALGDGRRITWGEASIGDHEQRIALLTRNATANAEAAARHCNAVSTLKMANVDRLADVPELTSHAE